MTTQFGSQEWLDAQLERASRMRELAARVHAEGVLTAEEVQQFEDAWQQISLMTGYCIGLNLRLQQFEKPEG